MPPERAHLSPSPQSLTAWGFRGMNAAADSKRITLDRGTVEELTKRGRVQCRTVSLHESHGEWIVSPSLTEPVERYAVLGDAVERWCELVEHLEVRR